MVNATPIRKDAWLQPRLKASLAEFEQRSCDNTLKWINHMATKQELSRYDSPLHTSHWSMLPPQTSLVFISWISTFFYPEIISSIIRYSIWVDVKGRLPVKIISSNRSDHALCPRKVICNTAKLRRPHLPAVLQKQPYRIWSKHMHTGKCCFLHALFAVPNPMLPFPHTILLQSALIHVPLFITSCNNHNFFP